MIPNTSDNGREEARRAGRKVAPWAWMISSAILLAIVGYILFFFIWARATDDAWIKIPEGATGKMVKDSLTRHLGEDYAGKVVALLTVDDTTRVRSGAYHVRKGQTVFNVARRMRHHAVDPMRFTILHRRSLDALAEVIGRRMGINPDSIMPALADTTVLADAGLTRDQALALYLEDTYENFWGTKPAAIVEGLAKHYKKVWNKERTEKAAALGLTPAQVMIVCSIVDEESNNLGEKGTIGRLYINRIHKGMKLQADPTVKFGIGDFTLRRITNEHLRHESPYNTYLHEGLPPGPIRTTSVQTIDAVLNEKPNDYLYMCAKEDFSGTHNFAKDFATHQANARRYQQALNERGIK